MTANHATLIGAAGVTLLLLAFLLNIARLMPAQGRPYMLANFLGASLACYSSYLVDFMPFPDIVRIVDRLARATAGGDRMIADRAPNRPHLCRTTTSEASPRMDHVMPIAPCRCGAVRADIPRTPRTTRGTCRC